MALKPKDPLLSIGKITVLIGQGIMAIAAAALVVGVPIVLFMQNMISAEMQAEFADPTAQFPVMAVIGVMILALAIVVAAVAFYIAKLMEEQDATIEAGFDVSGIIMVITLFILARVFRQGAAMREDLEGTV